MTRELNGAELAGFIKERQLKQVRNLRQEYGVVPTLCIVVSDTADPVIETYVRLKASYAKDIMVDVQTIRVPEGAMIKMINDANIDSNIHGIIVQLPLKNVSQISSIVTTILPDKDVDGLGSDAIFTSATAQAIDWLLSGYNIALRNKRIALLGRGRLVGAPLEKLWRSYGYQIVSFDIDSGDIRGSLLESDVIVTATGVPGRLTSADVRTGSVVVDAGTASESGVIVGDAADDLRQRQDITITPIKGGVGPLTVAVLFDHVIQAALKSVGKL